ncbi:MAG: hypothetical protein AAF703_23510 [Cyanobacteria bacterium P01_D01_bin.105]
MRSLPSHHLCSWYSGAESFFHTAALQRSPEALGNPTMATDQSTADYEAEQEKRSHLQDDAARERSLAQDALAHTSDSPPQPLCAQCVNWQPDRLLYLTDGTTQTRTGYCVTRAAADLSQMSQAHAQRCHLYEEEIPF